jgi:hypothetical protein
MVLGILILFYFFIEYFSILEPSIDFWLGEVKSPLYFDSKSTTKILSEVDWIYNYLVLGEVI